VTSLQTARGGGRLQAATALGKIGGPRATEVLIAALQDTEVRAEAAEALGVLGDPRARAPIAAALDNESRTGVRGAMIDAIEKLGDPPA